MELFNPPLKTMAHVRSLGGEVREATILAKLDDDNNSYLADFEGKKAHAIFNVFVGRYYVDDLYYEHAKPSELPKATKKRQPPSR